MQSTDGRVCDKVLLVQAKYDSVFANVLPAGIGYLSEFLTSRSIEHDVFDLNVAKNTESALHELIRRYRPALLGMSMMSLNFKYNYGVLQRIKDAFPALTIVAGGAHVSTMREEVLKQCPAIDYGVVLEGEYALVELVQGKDPASIQGLLFRDGDRVAYTGDRPFIQDLDNLPYPRYAKFLRSDYSGLMSLFTSRGCPYECTYCPVKLAIGQRFVPRSAVNIIDELEFHYKQGTREFSFRDDNFTLIKERVYAVCDEIERRGLRDLYLMCDNGVRADKVDGALLKRMKDVGFKMIGLGVESGDDRVLKSLKKSSTVRVMEDAIKTACDLGYIVELFLLIGAPGETRDDFEKTVRLAMKYPVMAASFYHLLPYPNTELYACAVSHKYLVRSPDEYLNDGSQRRNTPFLSTPEFSYEERREAFAYAYRMTARHVRRSQKEFSRRTIREKLIGRGVDRRIAGAIAQVYTTDIIYGLAQSPLASRVKKACRGMLVSARAGE